MMLQSQKGPYFGRVGNWQPARLPPPTETNRVVDPRGSVNQKVRGFRAEMSGCRRFARAATNPLAKIVKRADVDDHLRGGPFELPADMAKRYRAAALALSA